MRKAATLGLLAAALIPLSLDQQSPSHAGEPIALPKLAETSEIHAKIQTVLFTMERNGEIARSMQRAAKARERDRTIKTAPDRLDGSHTLAFTAERNAEIRQSLAAYERARDARAHGIATDTTRATLSTATRHAETLISRARANQEPLWTTLARLAPLIASTSPIEPPAIRIATAKSGLETGSIEPPAILGPCATSSP